MVKDNLSICFWSFRQTTIITQTFIIFRRRTNKGRWLPLWHGCHDESHPGGHDCYYTFYYIIMMIMTISLCNVLFTDLQAIGMEIEEVPPPKQPPLLPNEAPSSPLPIRGGGVTPEELFAACRFEEASTLAQAQLAAWHEEKVRRGQVVIKTR